jgi:hypothetical protein
MNDPYRRPDSTTDEPLARELALDVEEASLMDLVLHRSRTVRLRVWDGALEVVFGDGRAPVRVGLGSVHDLSLEDIGLSGLLGEGRCFRMVLVAGEEHERLPLSKGGLQHLLASDGLAHARLFLRSHGWLPEKERERPAPTSS